MGQLGSTTVHYCTPKKKGAGSPSSLVAKCTCNDGCSLCIISSYALLTMALQEWSGGCLYGLNCGGGCVSDTYWEGDPLDQACYQHDRCLDDTSPEQTQYYSSWSCEASGRVNCNCDTELARKAWDVSARLLPPSFSLSLSVPPPGLLEPPFVHARITPASCSENPACCILRACSGCRQPAG